jgi:glucose/arabinose dehydrogenase
MGRRALLDLAVGGLGVAAALPLSIPEAQGAPADPEAGALATPNPIKPRIAKSGLTVSLVDFSKPTATSSARPFANLNFLYHAGDGTSRLFANDSRGKLWRIDRSTGAFSLFLDLKAARGSALVANGLQQGLRSFAFHPDFARSGRPGYRKLYTISTETPGSRPSGVKLLAGSYPVVLHDVIAEWSLSVSNPSLVDPKSRREVLRIAEWARDHNADQLMFDPNAAVGGTAYGKLLIGTGDGGNFPSQPDPYNQAQNRLSPLGKILRINPLKSGSAAYTIPSDNPFVGKAGYEPSIWALGLRHPQNFSFDRGGAKRLIMTDIGQYHIEEVNIGIKGANYGWPLREGTFVTDRLDEQKLYARPTDDASRGYTYPVAQYDHDDGKAITGGFVYRGTRVPALAGQYLCGDMVNGRIFHAPAADLKPGATVALKELTLRRNGNAVTLTTLCGGANGRVDLRFGQDQWGEIYILTKQDGRIRKLAPA